MGEPDLPYAYDLFERITAWATVDGMPLAHLTFDGVHNLWHSLAQSAFIDECARFSETKRFTAEQRKPGISYFFTGGVAFLVTMIACAYAVVVRPKAFVYTVDNPSAPGGVDFRIERVYEELARHRVSYLEVVHTVIGCRFLVNLWKRRRPAVYLEGLEWAWNFVRPRAPAISVGGLESLSADERVFAEALVSKFVGVAPLFRFRIAVLARLMRASGTRVALAIDDARGYRDFVIAAKRAGVPSYAFQHGHVTPYHPGWLKRDGFRGEYARTDYLVVWNEYWKHEMIALNVVWPADALIIGGSAKKDGATKFVRAPDGAVLVPYESHAPREVVVELVRALNAAGARTVFKLRPDLPREVQLTGMGDIEIFNGQPVSCIIGTYSTLLSEAVGAGIPAGVVRTPLKFAKHLIDNRLAEPVSLADVPAALARLMSTSPEEAERRRSILTPVSGFSEIFGNILRACGIKGRVR